MKAFGVIVAGLIVFVTSVYGADIEQAKKEGEVVLYTTMVVTDFQVFQRAIPVETLSFLTKYF
jgi:Na+/glutamate symporter